MTYLTRQQLLNLGLSHDEAEDQLATWADDEYSRRKDRELEELDELPSGSWKREYESNPER